MGSLDARVHAPKGRSVARAAKEREAARSDDVRIRLRFIFVQDVVDGPTKRGGELGGDRETRREI
jgi:hypothetical protein